MPFSTSPIVLMFAAAVFVQAEALAQGVQDAPPAGAGGGQEDSASPQSEAPAVLTLKERLGAKWRDEQRVDNCKVPVEKRGVNPRPSRCVHGTGK